MTDRLMKKLADFVITRRLLVLIIITAITVYFGYQCRYLTVGTNFNELLPQTHPYVKIHNEFREVFGGANFLVIMVSVKDGTIFNRETLEKIRYLTNELEGLPGIDRYKIVSIASRKLKNTQITSWGLEAVALMYPEVPKDDKGMAALRNAIYSNEAYYGFYVSLDSKKSLIFADFFEGELNYTAVYQQLEAMRKKTEDGNTTVSIVGHPMHLGVVASMINLVNMIMLGTAIVIPILLFFAYRSIWATIMVPLAGVVSGIWGLGFMGIMRYNLDPLIFVMPFLISLMAFRHSHQLYNRYYEEYAKTKDNLAGIRVIIENMFMAGLTSIITDAFGIAIVALAPIPVLKNMAIAGAFWSIITVIVGLILTPVLLSYVPISSKFVEQMERERIADERREGFANRFADWLGPWLISKKGLYTVSIVILIILGFSYYWSEKLIIGDAQVGSNLLYPGSRYNQDSVRINQNLPLINPLFVVVKGDKQRSLTNPLVMEDVKNFTDYMMKNSGAAGYQNIIAPLMTMPQKFHEDDPKWVGLADDPTAASANLVGLLFAFEPGDMNKFIDPKIMQTNVVVYYKDKTGPTIDRAIATAKRFIKEYSRLPEGFEYSLAGGVIGTEASINEMVASKQLQTLIIALLGVFFFCTLNFMSIKAGLALTLPLALSNFMAFAYMAIAQIGLSVSTLPVSAAGIGMGVDYGIYLIARMEEEKKLDPAASLNTVMIRTIQTYGKSIMYIAGTLVAGLLVWVFSPLKFQAQMGLMLAVILFLNCLGAIFMVPVLVLLFKPKFLTGGK